ncbi:hypothetical protein [uncultured Vibrio sp.]|uniref:hypothetical protein n=1 Tax=uncultured Vibrio sp. TaxID=114054 RepID=UPI00261004D1|nr:hypothetical protein [uncultured Vibrio sp.]
MKLLTIEQARAKAISELAAKLGFAVAHNVDLDAPSHMQEKDSSRAKAALIAGIEKLIEINARDLLTDHVHGSYQGRIAELESSLREANKNHEMELQKLIEEVEGLK